MTGLWKLPESRAVWHAPFDLIHGAGGAAMRRKYLRFRKWALLKIIYTLAAILRFLKRQVPGGEARACVRANGRVDPLRVTPADASRA